MRILGIILSVLFLASSIGVAQDAKKPVNEYRRIMSVTVSPYKPLLSDGRRGKEMRLYYIIYEKKDKTIERVYKFLNPKTKKWVVMPVVFSKGKTIIQVPKADTSKTAPRIASEKKEVAVPILRGKFLDTKESFRQIKQRGPIMVLFADFLVKKRYKSSDPVGYYKFMKRLIEADIPGYNEKLEKLVGRNQESILKHLKSHEEAGWNLANLKKDGFLNKVHDRFKSEFFKWFRLKSLLENFPEEDLKLMPHYKELLKLHAVKRKPIQVLKQKEKIDKALKEIDSHQKTSSSCDQKKSK